MDQKKLQVKRPGEREHIGYICILFSRTVVVEDIYQEDWRRLRKEVLAEHSSSSSSLPMVTVREGELSPRHGSTQEWCVDIEAK